MNKKELATAALEPETFSSDRDPDKLPYKIKKIEGGFNDTLGAIESVFGVDGYAYVVTTVMNRMRRRVKLLGLSFLREEDQKYEIYGLPEGAIDPLSEVNYVFSVPADKDDEKRGIEKGDLLAYRVNNSRDNKMRTVKFMGKFIYTDSEEAL